MKRLYIAGGLFSEAQIAARIKEGEALRERFGSKLEIFNPIEQPYNQEKEELPTPEEIFIGDYEAIVNSDIVLFDMSDETDPGVAAELGIVASMAELGYDITPIGVYSDIRLDSSNQYHIPSYGVNHFTLGILGKHGYVVADFKSAMDVIEILINKK